MASGAIKAMYAEVEQRPLSTNPCVRCITKYATSFPPIPTEGCRFLDDDSVFLQTHDVDNLGFKRCRRCMTKSDNCFEVRSGWRNLARSVSNCF